MDSINMAFQHCIWNTKNWEPQIHDEGIRQELCEFIKGRTKAMDIGIDEIYCSASHLHYLCMYPENKEIAEIFLKLREQTQGWLAAKGYADVEWENDYLTLPVNEDELEKERCFIREQKNSPQNRPLEEVYKALFDRII